MFDVIVIGGSLAGSSTALLLARSGMRVLLVDKTTFPREKPCGEGLSGLGLQIAQNAGLLPTGNLPFHEFLGFELYSGGRRATLTHKYSSGVTVERSMIDTLLWKTAMESGNITVSSKSRGVAIQRGDDDLFTVQMQGDPPTHQSRIVVIASGAYSPLLETHSSVTTQQRQLRAGASGHFSGNFSSLLGMIHIFIDGDVETYLTPISPERANIAVLARSRDTSGLKDLLRNTPVTIEKTLRRELHAKQEGEIFGRSFLGNTKRTGKEHGIFLIGDSIEQFDPIGGMGMSHAFYSAVLASEKISTVLSRELSLDDGIERYECERSVFARSLQRFTSFTSTSIRIASVYPPALFLASTRVGRALAKAMSPKLKMPTTGNSATNRGRR